MGQYTTIQIKRDLNEELHHYCAERGYTKSGLIESLIKERINQSTKPKPLNVLRVST